MDNNNEIAIASDHAAFKMKENLKIFIQREGYRVIDYGTSSEESVDYPDFIHPLAKDINEGKYCRGIILCGSGNGVSMVANKYNNIRAALCWIPEIAKYARSHNDANILSLPARFISIEKAKEIVNMFLKTNFEGGRHEIRVKKIKKS